jgi:hypothetical protein
MGLGDIFDAIFRIYRQNFLTCIGVVALLQVPLLAIQAIVTLVLGERVMSDLIAITDLLPTFDPRTDSFADLPLGNFAALIVSSLVLGLLQVFIVQQLVTGGLVHTVEHSYANSRVSILGAYGFGALRMLWLVIAGFLVSLLAGILYLIPIGIFGGSLFMLVQIGVGQTSQEDLGVAVLLLFVGSMVLLFVSLLTAVIALMFLFVPQVIVVEGHGPFTALVRSLRLVFADFWRVLGVGLLLSILVSILAAVPSGVVSSINNFFLNDVNDFILSQSITIIVSNLVNMVLLPVQIIGYTVLYYDVRVRKEGLDLALRAQEVTG